MDSNKENTQTFKKSVKFNELKNEIFTDPATLESHLKEYTKSDWAKRQLMKIRNENLLDPFIKKHCLRCEELKI